MPSQMTITSATIQPSIACGPPSADMRSGIVMNGPAPIMFVMFSAVAESSPKRRWSRGCSGGISPSLARAAGAVMRSTRAHDGRAVDRPLEADAVRGLSLEVHRAGAALVVDGDLAAPLP